MQVDAVVYWLSVWTHNIGVCEFESCMCRNKNAIGKVGKRETTS